MRLPWAAMIPIMIFWLLFLLFTAFWTCFWQLQVSVCSTSNLFLALWSFSQQSQPVSGSAVAVVGQCWTKLIESGCVPVLATCHISTEQRTLSQLQILAAGHFLAGGISSPSQTYTHMDTQTAHRVTHSCTDADKCIKMCAQRGQMRHRLSGGGWLRCEHVNDRRMDKNNQASTSLCFHSFRSMNTRWSGDLEWFGQITYETFHLDLLVATISLNHTDRLLPPSSLISGIILLIFLWLFINLIFWGTTDVTQ